MQNPKADSKIVVWPKERLSGFTDGVFAFAITLLVLNLIDLNIPSGNQSLLPFVQENAAALITFAVTFFIIARFWMAHTRLFALVHEFDSGIVKLNMTLLFFITVFPFVASILGTHMGNSDAVILYAACFAAVGILQYMIGRHAYIHKLLIESDILDGEFIKVFTSYTLSTPAVFIVSIFVAFFSATFAEYLWVILLFLRLGVSYYYRASHEAKTEIDNL